MRLLSEFREKSLPAYVPDTVIFEFETVLMSNGTKTQAIREALLALRRALAMHAVKEVFTLDSELLAKQCEIQEKHDLAYFDSLIASSTLRLDSAIVSDDRAYDRVPGILRTKLSREFSESVRKWRTGP